MQRQDTVAQFLSLLVNVNYTRVAVADLGITNGGCKDFAREARGENFLTTPTSGR